MGSILVLALLLFEQVLPQVLACLATVAVLESMTGGIHLRAVMELVDGRRTFPGSGFSIKTEYRWQGILAVVLLLLLKVLCLSQIRSDWQPFSVLLAPILGRGSQALGIIFSKQRLDLSHGKVEPEVKSRQKRALIFMAVLLTVMGLFPYKTSAILIAQYFILMGLAFRFLNARMEGLTVQTLGSVAEMTELSFLLFVAILS